MLTAATAILASVKAAVTDTLQVAENKIESIHETIDGIAESIAASLRGSVQGISKQILGLINAVPLPNIPGASQAREVAANLLKHVTGAVMSAFTEVLGFVRSTVAAGMSLAASFLGVLQQVVSGALALASSAIAQILQAVVHALTRAMNFMTSILNGILHTTVWPLLEHLESLLEGGIAGAEQQAREQIRANEEESLDVIDAAASPEETGGAAKTAASSKISGLQEIVEAAAQNNRMIVRTLIERTSASVGMIFSGLASVAGMLVQQLTAGIARALHAIAGGVVQVIRSLSQVIDTVAGYFQTLLRNLAGGLGDLVQYVRSLAQGPADQFLESASSVLSRIASSIKLVVLNLISGDSDSSLAELTGALTGSLTTTPSRGPITKPPPPVFEIIIRLAIGLIVSAVGALMVFLFGAELAAIIMANPVLAVAILVLLVVLVVLALLLLYFLFRLIKPKPRKPPPTKRVVLVTPSALELGVGGRDIRATATIAPGKPPSPPLTWTVNPGGTAPAGVGIIGSSLTVRVNAAQPPAGTIVGGTPVTVRAALTANPADFEDSAPIMLVQVVTVAYTAVPPLALVPSLGTPPPNTAEPNRDGIAGNTALVNATTAPVSRPINVTFRRSLGASVAGATVTPSRNTGDIGLRISDTATDARLDETKPATAGPAALIADLAINAVPTKVAALAGAGPLGPYGVLNSITFASSDGLHPPLTRIVGELITNGGDDFNIPPPNGAFNNVFLLALAAPANQWNDQLITPTGILNVADGRPAIDVNRFVGPGVPHLPRAVIYRQRFQYSAWTGAGTVISNTIADGRHIRSLIGSPGAFQFKTEHKFGSVAAPAHLEPYLGNPLIVFSNITATPTAPGATGLAADGVATANLGVTSSVAGRTVNWSVRTGDMVITGGNPAVLPATATLRAGVRTGNFTLRVADTILPNRLADGRVGLITVSLKNIRAARSSVPPGTNSTTVTLDAEPGGRAVNWSVDAAAAAAGVTVNPAVTGPGAPPMTVTVTRPAGFSGRVTVTAKDSVVTKTANVSIRFR